MLFLDNGTCCRTNSITKQWCAVDARIYIGVFSLYLSVHIFDIISDSLRIKTNCMFIQEL